jgi:hypothetical protein
MVFKTGNMIILEEVDSDLPTYKSPEDIPGYRQASISGFANWPEIQEFVSNNLHKPRMCVQVLETQQVANTAFVNDTEKDNARVIAGYGFRSIKNLGEGKDGYTFLGQKYLDTSGQNYIVKVYKRYQQDFNVHTKMFIQCIRDIVKEGREVHDALIPDTVAKDNFMYYPTDKPYGEVSKDPKMILEALGRVCGLNAWCIVNTGFVFWDLGYGNGRNFMMNTVGKRKVKWIDYGGAGMLRCEPHLKKMLSVRKNVRIHETTAPAPKKAKENLIYAKSDFIYMQFMLNYLFFTNKKAHEIGVWSSLTQIDSTVLQQFKDWVFPNLLTDEFSQRLSHNFKDEDWTSPKTWTKLENWIYDYKPRKG